MASFKKFVSAKEKVEENHIPKTMNKNYFIRKEINEDGGMNTTASTSGGEIDSLFAAVGAAAALVGKSIYNGIIYAKLKSELPKYIEQYKITQAPSSRAVFDFNVKKKQSELKKQKEMLTGSGGSRQDRELSGDRATKDAETSTKQKISDMYKDKITAAEGKQKEVLRKERDAALDKIDLKVQQLQKKIEEINDNADVAWDKAKETFRQYDEAFAKKIDGFIEVRDSVLASSWRKKWDKEFVIAKNTANIEVLAEAKKIATDQKDKEEVEAITKSEARAKESQKAAEEALGAIEADAEEAEGQMKSAEELGITETMTAAQELDNGLKESVKKWKGKAEEAKGATEESIRSSLTNMKTLLESLSIDSTNSITTDIAFYESEFNKITSTDNVSHHDLYILSIHLNETFKYLISSQGNELLLEAKDEDAANMSTVKKYMDSAISNAPDEDKSSIAKECASDLESLKSLKQKYVSTINKCADAIKSAKEDENFKMPPGLSGFGDLSKKDEKEETEPYDKAIEELKKIAGGEGGKEEEEEGKEEKPDNTEKIAALDSKIEGLEKDKKTKSDELNSLNHPDVLAVEVAIKIAKLQKAELGDDEDAIKSAEAALKTAQDDKKEAVKKEDSSKEKKDSGAEESVETDIPAKFMKFEDYLSMKQKNI
jgi:hypothetical protein